MSERDDTPGGRSDPSVEARKSPGPTRLIKESEQIKRAMLARPRLGLRLQLLMGFLLVFLLSLGIATAIIISIYKVESKIKFMEIVEDYTFEVDKARRFEKNFFLYRTNLDDALDSAIKAKQILVGSRDEFSKTIGKALLQDILRNIHAYEQLLERLVGNERVKDARKSGASIKGIELKVRELGHRMNLLSQDVMKKERRSIEVAIARSRKIQIYSLIFMLIFMITTAYLISGNIVRSIVRIKSYTQRIAAGDFTPITPARRYRDEFTEVGLAINYMMQELEKHEGMLIQAHKMRAIGTLTAGIAHELNNPLNNITITAHMFLEDHARLDESERTEMIGDVVKEAERAKTIVANLLDFTRESEIRLEPLDLVQLVRDTISLAVPQIRIAGIKVDFSAIDDPPAILGDSQQLRQVFLNLILNAVAASPRGSKIQLLVHPSDEPNHLSVKIIDYGTGIPRHVLPRIFDPFFTTKEAGKGTGLGLSVSQGIIDKHGGRLLVDSQEGRGSTFTVCLPVATQS
jgi:two-component system NtrC family sensor kinase